MYVDAFEEELRWHKLFPERVVAGCSHYIFLSHTFSLCCLNVNGRTKALGFCSTAEFTSNRTICD
jgi:glutamate racemase